MWLCVKHKDHGTDDVTTLEPTMIHGVMLGACPEAPSGRFAYVEEHDPRLHQVRVERRQTPADVMAKTKYPHYHPEATGTGWWRCGFNDCPEMWDRWLCTKRIKVRNQPRYEVCGLAYYYKRKSRERIGGPHYRGLDRRYGYGYAYNCKHDAPFMQRHESAPDPDQPEQDPLLKEQIEKLKVVAKEARKKNRGRKKA